MNIWAAHLLSRWCKQNELKHSLKALLGSFILDHTGEVKISLSAYYYSAMRTALVGIMK
jgi:hypothetical protein